MNGSVETKRLKFFIVCGFFLLASQMLTSCAVFRTGLESGSAYLEQPSMELVLDRLNTASSASMMVDVIFNDMAVSDTATWPRRLEKFADKDLQPVLRALALDGAYVSHGGFISPIKAHVVQAQHILYELPPDMYSSGGDFYKNGEETIING